MLNRTWIYRDTMLLPKRFNVSTKAEWMEPSFPCQFVRVFVVPSFPSFFIFLQFRSFAILSPVFFLFLGLFRLVCRCCFYVFSLLRLFLDFLLSSSTSLFCFSSSFSPFSFLFFIAFPCISTVFSYLLSFPSLYSWLSMVQWPWCKEGKPRGCCSQVLPRAGGCSCKPPGFVRLG